MKKTIIFLTAALTAAMVLSSCASTKGASKAADSAVGVAGVPYITLNNGAKMPAFGLGTVTQGSDEVCRESVKTALLAGYRHIDTAHGYRVERGVGQGIKDSGIPREEIWLTSKLWPTEYGEGVTLAAIDKMLERLQTDYVDLLYIHHPIGDVLGAWKDMEKAVAQGKVRTLGVSNFENDDELLAQLLANVTIKPAIMQIECHTMAQRTAEIEKIRANGMAVECWYTIGRARPEVLEEPTLVEIAKRHGKTTPQIILRWHIQEGHSAIPGSKNPDHIRENLDIFDFELTDEEMNAIRASNKEKRIFQQTPERLQSYLNIQLD